MCASMCRYVQCAVYRLCSSVQERDILKEVAVFCLASHMLWLLWGLKQVTRDT